MKLDWDKINFMERWLAAMQISFECDMCGGCCQRMEGIAYASTDCDRMAKHMGMGRNDWMRQYTIPSTKQKGDRWIKLEGEGLRCPFLTDKGCSQYEGRSQVCRGFPYYTAEQINHIKAHENFILYKNCPGMLKTYLHMLENDKEISYRVAQQIVAGPFGQYCMLQMIKERGRGEEAKYAARELGLDDVPPVDRLKGIARTYALAYVALLSPERREVDMMNIKRMLEESESQQ